MTKTKTAKAKSNGKKVMSRPRIPRSLSTGLDEQALCWARLLADPCQAPLCHPCYNGADGGILTRFENSYDIGTGATDTAGLFNYVPGAIASSSGNANGIFTYVAPSSAGSPVVASVVNTVQPGFGFLNTNASSVRCVAACLQVFYLGAEANRSGIINYGNTTGNTFSVGDVVNVNNASNIFPKFERTPLNLIEIKWRPNNYDQTWQDTTQATNANETGKRAGIGFSFSGLQAAAGYRVRMVAVYEYVPANNVGITLANTSRNTSKHSLERVIDYLDAGGDWMTRTGESLNRLFRGANSVAPYVRAVAYGGSRALSIMG